MTTNKKQKVKNRIDAHSRQVAGVPSEAAFQASIARALAVLIEYNDRENRWDEVNAALGQMYQMAQQAQEADDAA